MWQYLTRGHTGVSDPSHRRYARTEERITGSKLRDLVGFVPQDNVMMQHLVRFCTDAASDPDHDLAVILTLTP